MSDQEKYNEQIIIELQELRKELESLNISSDNELYIEDNISNIELIEQILTAQRPDIRLTTHINGKQTVKLAIDCQPDLILLDLDLPDIHGSEVKQLMLAEERTKNIPVVIISADAMPQQIGSLLKSRAKDYLTKPLEIMGFLKVIDDIIIGRVLTREKENCASKMTVIMIDLNLKNANILIIDDQQANIDFFGDFLKITLVPTGSFFRLRVNSFFAQLCYN